MKERISPRERQVLLLYAIGLSERAIAERLGVSHSAIKVRLRNLYARWRLRDEPHVSMARQAVIVALATGVFTVQELADGLRKELT